MTAPPNYGPGEQRFQGFSEFAYSVGQSMKNEPTTNCLAAAREFYDREYLGSQYCVAEEARLHPFFSELQTFLDQCGGRQRKCLEVGSGRGAFQDLVEDYTGVDVAQSVARYYRKPFFATSATSLPFPDDTFDVIWSYAVLEHVHQPEVALREIRRVLRPEGDLLLAPAWFCRPWAADGYPVRPYRDLPWKGKLIKASIPVRESLVFRSLWVLPWRLWRWARYVFGRSPTGLSYGTLRPNYERFWMADSDAVNILDPHEVMLWFVSRGDQCLTCPTGWSRLLFRTGPVAFRIAKFDQ